ncbi:MAG: PAS domain S-box protein, partial [Actinobacteria bacterium]|nr:PAS domain S-box protein [Actinomycetota bacterium]
MKKGEETPGKSEDLRMECPEPDQLNQKTVSSIELFLSGKSELSRRILQDCSLNELVELTIRIVQDLSGLECALMCVRDESSDSFGIYYSSNLSTEFETRFNDRIEGLFDFCEQNDAPFLYTGSNDVPYPLCDTENIDNLKSVVFVPFYSERIAAGFLMLSSRFKKDIPGEALVDIELLAAQLAQFIRGAELKEALKESRSKYEMIMNNIDDVIWVIDNNMNAIYLSPSIEKLTGFTAVETLDLEPVNLVTSESLEKLNDVLDQIAEDEVRGCNWNDKTWMIEMEMYRKDGRTTWIEMKLKFLRDVDGTPVGAIGVSRDVNHRKKIENVLVRSEEKYRNLYHSSIDGILLADMQGRIVEANEAFLSMVGYRMKEIEGMPAEKIMPKMKADIDIDNIYTQLFQKGNSGEMEADYTRKDGIRVPISLKAWLANDENGEPFGVWVIIRDISGVKRTEKFIEAQRDLALSAVGDVSLDDILDTALKVILEAVGFEGGYISLTGKSRGKLDLEHHTGISKSFMWAANHIDPNVYEGKAIRSGMQLFVGQDELSSPLKELAREEDIKSIGIIPMVSELGEIAGSIGVFSRTLEMIPRELRNILDVLTKQVERTIGEYRMAEALRVSEEKHRLLAENVTDVIWTMGMDLNFNYISPSIEMNTGFTPDEVRTMPLHEVFTPLSLRSLTSAFAQAIQDDVGGSSDPEAFWTVELEFYRKNGSTVWNEVRINTLREVGGRLAGVLGISRDITERKKAERELKQAKEA